MSRSVAFGGPKVTQIAPGQCLLNLAEQNLCNVLRPSKLLIKPISGGFDVLPFDNSGGNGLVPQYGSPAQNELDPDPLFSGLRTGIPLEGPFLRYELASGARDWFNSDKIKINGVNTSSDTVQFFFDLLGNRPMLLPYPGKVSVISQYPGSWAFEYFLIDSDLAEAMANVGLDSLEAIAPSILLGNHAVRKGSPLEGDATLSLRVGRTGGASQSTRIFGAVPLGCHSLTYSDNLLDGAAPLPTLTIASEPITTGFVGQFPKVVGAGGIPVDTIVPLVMLPSTGAFMTRIGHFGGQQLAITSGANDAAGIAQFHSSFV